MGKRVIYADYAATTPLDSEALEAMLPFLRENYGNPSSAYSFSRSAKKALTTARETIAECIGAQPDEICFTSGGSESNNCAITNLACRPNVPYRRILTSPLEHHSILNACQNVASLLNVEIQSLPVDALGHILPHEFERNLTSECSGISIMLANNEIGTIENLAALTEIGRAHRIPFHTDAVQAVGHIPIDVRSLGVDLLSASAHKFHGPKGIGFLFIHRAHSTPFRSLINGGNQELGRRAGTENVASIVGMAVALKNCCERMESSVKWSTHLENVLKTRLRRSMSDIIFNGDSKNHLPGHVSLSCPGISGEALLHFLDLRGIFVSTGSACNSHNDEISHVLKAIRLPAPLAKSTIRVTLGTQNTEEDSIVIAEEIIAYYGKITSCRETIANPGKNAPNDIEYKP